MCCQEEGKEGPPYSWLPNGNVRWEGSTPAGLVPDGSPQPALLLPPLLWPPYHSLQVSPGEWHSSQAGQPVLVLGVEIFSVRAACIAKWRLPCAL